MKYDEIFSCLVIFIKNCALAIREYYHLFILAVQTQAGWSFAEDVNLLASGYNRPDVGSAGSGIYLGN